MKYSFQNGNGNHMIDKDPQYKILKLSLDNTQTHKRLTSGSTAKTLGLRKTTKKRVPSCSKVKMKESVDDDHIQSGFPFIENPFCHKVFITSRFQGKEDPCNEIVFLDFKNTDSGNTFQEAKPKRNFREMKFLEQIVYSPDNVLLKVYNNFNKNKGLYKIASGSRLSKTANGKEKETASNIPLHHPTDQYTTSNSSQKVIMPKKMMKSFSQSQYHFMKEKAIHINRLKLLDFKFHQLRYKSVFKSNSIQKKEVIEKGIALIRNLMHQELTNAKIKSDKGSRKEKYGKSMTNLLEDLENQSICDDVKHFVDIKGVGEDELFINEKEKNETKNEKNSCKTSMKYSGSCSTTKVSSLKFAKPSSEREKNMEGYPPKKPVLSLNPKQSRKIRIRIVSNKPGPLELEEINN